MCNLSFLKRGLQVLVVDSDQDSVDLLRMVFEEFGVNVIAANCVEESLKILEQVRPDFLISELILPDADGYSLIKQVKAFELIHQVRIPVIAVTAWVTGDSRLQALTAGFDDYLSKPIDIDTFIKTVACVVEQAQAMV